MAADGKQECPSCFGRPCWFDLHILLTNSPTRFGSETETTDVRPYVSAYLR